MKKFQSKSWYPYTVAVCAGVVLYVALTHLPSIGAALASFSSYFSPVIVGIILAYLMNPLAAFFKRTIFRNLKKGSWTASVALTVAAIIAVILVLILIVVPALIESIDSFSEQLPQYQQSLHELTNRLGLTGVLDTVNAEELTGQVFGYIKDHTGAITSTTVGVIKTIVNVVIGAVLALYLLNSKSGILRDIYQLTDAILPTGKMKSVLKFAGRCNDILGRYLIFTLLDSVIVGVVNAIVMLILRMPYIGLISIIAGVTNLVPTFGPVIGAAVGGFLLLLVSPKYALMLIVISVVIQIADGYILKPRLFGNTLGVSGALILLAIVIMGNIFGIVGILLAIPAAAILDFSYRGYLLPSLQKKKKLRQKAADKADTKYYAVNDFYNMESGGSLHLLSRFKTLQQTTEYTCGSASALMVLEHYGIGGYDEMKISELAGTDSQKGTSVEGLAAFFESVGLSVDWHASTERRFEDIREAESYLAGMIDKGCPVLVDWVDWAGHWQIVIGIDTCSVDNPYDDVLIMADPYDVTDHVQDGYYIVPFGRFFEMWREGPCADKDAPYEQPFIAVIKP